jgi:hypothetical protein
MDAREEVAGMRVSGKSADCDHKDWSEAPATVGPVMVTDSGRVHPLTAGDDGAAGRWALARRVLSQAVQWEVLLAEGAWKR